MSARSAPGPASHRTCKRSIHTSLNCVRIRNFRLWRSVMALSAGSLKGLAMPEAVEFEGTGRERSCCFSCSCVGLCKGCVRAGHAVNARWSQTHPPACDGGRLVACDRSGAGRHAARRGCTRVHVRHRQHFQSDHIEQPNHGRRGQRWWCRAWRRDVRRRWRHGQSGQCRLSRQHRHGWPGWRRKDRRRDEQPFRRHAAGGFK